MSEEKTLLERGIFSTDDFSKPKSKRIYTKRSPYWRITLKQRILAAIKGFKRGR